MATTATGGLRSGSATGGSSTTSVEWSNTHGGACSRTTALVSWVTSTMGGGRGTAGNLTVSTSLHGPVVRASLTTATRNIASEPPGYHPTPHCGKRPQYTVRHRP